VARRRKLSLPAGKWSEVAEVAALLVADVVADSVPLARLFGEIVPALVTRDELRSATPFVGRVAELLRVARESGAGPLVVGLVVPVVWVRSGLRPALATIADHVNVGLRGPLTGRWPAGVPRSFPTLTGIYQPALIRTGDDPHVYSEALVAGVTDGLRLTPFEQEAVRETDCDAIADCLVAPVITAAYHALTVAACGVPQASLDGEGGGSL
jgi:hypothetical protein